MLEDLIIAHMPVGTVDTWDLTLTITGHLTVTAAPSAAANIMLSVIDPHGKIIVDDQNQDQSPAGAVETISDLQITIPGEYQIQVRSDSPVGIDYALMALDDESYAFSLRGSLHPGVERADSLPVDSDHFWFFTAYSGSYVGFKVSPEGDSDAYVEFYGPDGRRLQTIDNSGDGEPEILDDFLILSSGMYGIRVGEFDFAAMPYEIVWEQQSPPED